MSLKADVRIFARDAEKNPELAREVLWRILVALEQAQKAVRRDAILVAILAALFELMNRKLIGEASALGIKVVKLDFLRYILPVAIGYVTFHAASGMRERDILHDVFMELTAAAFPMLHKSNIDYALIPTSSTHANIFPRSWMTPGTWRVTQFLDLTEGLIVRGIIPIGFIAYATFQLFRSSAPPHLGAWLSALSASALVFAGYLTYISFELDMRDTGEANGDETN